jgi:phage FluMu protein Com
MNEDFQSSVLASISKCPSCSGELEKGYVVTEAISFDTKKKRFFRGPKYVLTKYPTWTVLTLPALRCDKCNIVIIDYRGS